MKKISGSSVFCVWAICCDQDEELLFHIKKMIPISTWMQSHASRPSLAPTKIPSGSLVQGCAHYVEFNECKHIDAEA